MEILPQRIERIKDVISSRQYDLTVVLENVHDPHNIGAVLRTCDSVGIREIFIIYTAPILQERGISIGLRSASGAKKWIDVHYFEDIDEGMQAVKSKYDQVFGTLMKEDSKSLYDLPLTDSCAILFGNEHEGISEAACKYIDYNFLIPQHGFVQSLNISVACAVTLYEAQRQRLAANKYSNNFGERKEDDVLYDHYVEKHHAKRLAKAKKRIYF